MEKSLQGLFATRYDFLGQKNSMRPNSTGDLGYIRRNTSLRSMPRKHSVTLDSRRTPLLTAGESGMWINSGRSDRVLRSIAWFTEVASILAATQSAKMTLSLPTSLYRDNLFGGAAIPGSTSCEAETARSAPYSKIRVPRSSGR